jgi:hypothetical protein
MKTFLAIGTLSSGKSFRYADSAIDIVAFAKYMAEIYPTFEIDCIVLVADTTED